MLKVEGTLGPSLLFCSGDIEESFVALCGTGCSVQGCYSIR